MFHIYLQYTHIQTTYKHKHKTTVRQMTKIQLQKGQWDNEGSHTILHQKGLSLPYARRQWRLITSMQTSYRLSWSGKDHRFIKSHSTSGLSLFSSIVFLGFDWRPGRSDFSVLSVPPVSSSGFFSLLPMLVTGSSLITGLNLLRTTTLQKFPLAFLARPLDFLTIPELSSVLGGKTNLAFGAPLVFACVSWPQQSQCLGHTWCLVYS